MAPAVGNHAAGMVGWGKCYDPHQFPAFRRRMPPSIRRPFVAALTLLATCSSASAQSAKEPLPWIRSPWFDELSFTAAVEPKMRMHVNAPLDSEGRAARATRLIIFATPNGNTIEQTLGCKKADGLDWHYEIQHIAAQVRLLRELFPDERIALIVVQANSLSWPNWRQTVPEANAKIARMIDDWRRRFGTDDCKVAITGHSGGGSFNFGAIEGADQLPEYVDRFAFLDSNYSFDADKHAAKFETWLKGDDSRRLVVICYDDREIMLDGKKVVGPTGGTFRATGRMRDALGKVFPLAESDDPPFHETVGLDGRIHFYIHPNPENKILHTVLVGEMNGLVHALTLGTSQEGKWGTFGGPRAYTKWVQPEPTTFSRDAQQSEPVEPTTNASQLPTAVQAQLPPRPKNAMSGTAFVESLAGLNLVDREAAILREIAAGNFPEFLRNFKIVELRGKSPDGKEIVATIEVMPDYLAVGSDDDFVRMPMTPQTAQRIADDFACTLPTRKIVDAVDAAAEVHVAPHPLTQEREAVSTFLQHHQIIEKQRAGKPLDRLITGIKKDIVLTPRIFEKPERLAIYGWRQLDGKPIQPLTIVHWDKYVDYSHGARLVNRTLHLGGQNLDIAELLADPARASLVSDEGPMDPPRYPLDESSKN